MEHSLLIASFQMRKKCSINDEGSLISRGGDGNACKRNCPTNRLVNASKPLRNGGRKLRNMHDRFFYVHFKLIPKMATHNGNDQSSREAIVEVPKDLVQRKQSELITVSWVEIKPASKGRNAQPVEPA